MSFTVKIVFLSVKVMKSLKLTSRSYRRSAVRITETRQRGKNMIKRKEKKRKKLKNKNTCTIEKDVSSFLLNALKTLFRLSTVLLDL